MGLHTPASWHASGVGQTTGFAPVHTPALHASLWVQAFPSLQALPVKGAHVPSVGAPAPFEQASQAPALHAVLQQTPSTQNPDAHCEADVHGDPNMPVVLLVMSAVTTRANGCGPLGTLNDRTVTVYWPGIGVLIATCSSVFTRSGVPPVVDCPLLNTLPRYVPFGAMTSMSRSLLMWGMAAGVEGKSVQAKVALNGVVLALTVKLNVWVSFVEPWANPAVSSLTQSFRASPAK
jgi:hypothetical protein